jgi:hypothetical protein
MNKESLKKANIIDIKLGNINRINKLDYQINTDSNTKLTYYCDYNGGIDEQFVKDVTMINSVVNTLVQKVFKDAETRLNKQLEEL